MSVPWYLVVHDASYQFVKHEVDYIHSRLTRYAHHEVALRVLGTLDGLDPPANALVLVVGDAFAPPRQGRVARYVFVNFSLVLALGHPFRASLAGHRWILGKRRRFLARVRHYDYVLDFHPRQTRRLRQVLRPIPVEHFPVCVDLPEEGAASGTVYDVCVVGGASPRRQRVYKQLEEAGARLSPMRGENLHDVARRSRIVLNISFHRSPNLELPRMIGALASRAVLVSERNDDADQAIPPEVYVAAPWSSLGERTLQLLRDEKELEAYQRAGFEWFSRQYAPHADARWKALLARLEAWHGA